MGHKEKSVYYQALKASDVELKPYNQYKEAELAELALALVQRQKGPAPEVPPAELPEARDELGLAQEAEEKQAELPEPPAEAMKMVDPSEVQAAARAQKEARSKRSNVNEDTYAGLRQNTKQADEVIRVDDRGREWLQEEVRKPAYAKPRARRVTRYMDTGTETRQVGSGGQFESFEVAGKLERPAEIKTTLPTFQTGIYRHPSYPFKVHTYGGREGFDLFEVRNYFGGADLVPEEIKHVYISQDLCYDIRTTKRAIDELYRRMVLNREGTRA